MLANSLCANLPKPDFLLYMNLVNQSQFFGYRQVISSKDIFGEILVTKDWPSWDEGFQISGSESMLHNHGDRFKLPETDRVGLWDPFQMA